MAKVGVEIIGDATSLLRALGESSTAVDRFGVAYTGTFDEMSSATLRLAVAQDKLAISTAKFGQGSTGAAAAALSYRNQVEAMGASQLRAAQAVGRSLSTFVTAPVALLGYEAIKMGTNFQSAMLQIQTQAGASAGEVHALSKEVLDFASGGAQQGPVVLAQGLYHLESVGLRGAAAMGVLKEASKAAALGMASLEDVSTALGGVVVTGIRGAQDYAQAMGTLNAGIGAGNMRMTDLVAALGTGVVPAAHAAGISLTELMAAMAVMTDRGIPAEMAGTRLRMTFALMQRPTNAASKALADLGINADGLGTMLRQPNGLLNVIQLLHDRIQAVGSTRGNRDLLAGFGGGRSGSGIQTLVASLDSPISSLQGKLKQIAATSGNLQVSEAAQQQTAAAKFHTALASMEADMTKLGGAIMPTATLIVGGISGIAKAFSDLPKSVKGPLGVLVGALAVTGPLLVGGAALAKFVKSIGGAFETLPARAGPALGSVGQSAVVAGGEVGVLGKSLQQLGPDAQIGAAEASAALSELSVPLATTSTEVAALQTRFLGLGPAAAAGAVEVGGAMNVMATDTALTTSKVGLLRSSLLSISGMVITATIVVQEIFTHKKQIDSFLGGLGKDFANSIDSWIPGQIGQSLKDSDLRSALKGGQLSWQDIAKGASGGDKMEQGWWATIVKDNPARRQQAIDAGIFPSAKAESSVLASAQAVQAAPKDGTEMKVSGGTIAWRGGKPYLYSDKVPRPYVGQNPAGTQAQFGKSSVQDLTPAEASQMVAQQKTHDEWVSHMMSQVPGSTSPIGTGAPQAVTAGAPGIATPTPFTAAQQLELNLAAHPTDEKYLNQKAAADQSAINWLTRRRNEGKITDAEYVKQVKALYADKQSMLSQVASLGTKATNAAKAAAKLATTIPMALQVQQAEAATTSGTQDDVAAAQAIKSWAQNLITKNHLTGQALVDALNTITTANQTINQFTVPIAYQLAQAKAATTVTYTDDVKAAQGIKDWANAQIKSGTLGPQAMIAALGVVAQANQTLSQVTVPISMQLAQAKAAANDNTAAQLQVAAQIKSWALDQIAHGHLSAQAMTAAWGIVAQAKQTLGAFNVPWKIQLGQAEAALTATTSDDIANANALKAYAQKELKSKKLSHAGILAALAAIQQANQVLGAAPTHSVKLMTSSSFVKDLKFATPQDKLRAEQRFAQSQAHAGHIPTAHGVLGQSIVINVNGAGNPDTVAATVVKHLDKRTRHTVIQTRGHTAGSRPY